MIRALGRRSDGFKVELGEHNITVNALVPGLVDTALTRYEKRLSESMGEQGAKVEHPTPQQAWDNGSPTMPLKMGWLQPDDISPAAVFLALDAANMVTGAEYEVTGGHSAKGYLIGDGRLPARTRSATFPRARRRDERIRSERLGADITLAESGWSEKVHL
jgi:hypothetical protein